MTRARLSLLSKIAELWAEFPAYNRFLRDGGSDIPSPTEAHILVEIDSVRNPTGADIADRLQLDKGGISRLLADLAKRGMIETSPDSTNLRRKILALTELGKGVLRKFDRETDARYHDFVTLAGMSNRDLEALVHFMNIFACDSTGRQGGDRREHPLRWSIRELTRRLKYLTASDLRGGLTALQFQSLLFLSKAGEATSVGELADILRVPQNTLSQALIVLGERGFIRRATDRGDERFSKSKITPKGEDILGTIARHTARLLERSASSISTPQLQDGERLMARFVGGAATHFWLLSRRLSISELAGKGEIQAARRLLIRYWTESPVEQEIPPFILSDANRKFALRCGEKLVAIAEVELPRSRTGRPRLVNLGWDQGEAISRVQVDLFAAVALDSASTSKTK